MLDIRHTTAPKSDQLNADDLIVGNRTIKVTGVSLCETPDQPIAIHFEGDNGRPYKPCLTMRRVIVNIWGANARTYAGKSMTLYRDDKVMFGNVAVGGIRISHISGIEEPVTMAVTVTRTSRKPFTVSPLRLVSAAPEATAPGEAIKLTAEIEAKKGTESLKAFWTTLSAQQREELKPFMPRLKATAQNFDTPQAVAQTGTSAPPAGRSAPQEVPAAKEAAEAITDTPAATETVAPELQTASAITAARARGVADFWKGISITDIPAEYQGQSALITGWHTGMEEAAARAKKGLKGGAAPAEDSPANATPAPAAGQFDRTLLTALNTALSSAGSIDELDITWASFEERMQSQGKPFQNTAQSVYDRNARRIAGTNQTGRVKEAA